MSIPITLLQQLETISALKVLVYLYDKSLNNGVIRVSVNQIIDESGIARNSAKRGLTELLSKKVVEQIATGKGNHPNTYKVSKVDNPILDSPNVVGPKVDPTNVEGEKIAGWNKATGSKAKGDSEPKVDPTENNDIINIIYKDFKDFNFFYNDINSLSIFNTNLNLNDEQLGKLARRVLIEWYLPLANFDSKQPPYFFPQQMKLIKDLLVAWRTDQVLASIQYWTKINPPKNGMKSLAWLNFKKKGIGHVQVALDHYKQEYLGKQEELEEVDRKKKVEEMRERAIEVAKENVAKKIKVDEMSDNDFLKDLLGGIGKIEIGGG